MVSDVISAVSNALYEEFGSGYKIYADNVEQGLTRPSFFINVIRPAVTERIMNRSNVDVPLVIQYFPSSIGKRLECYAVADQMFQCLKYPTYNDVTYRGVDLKYDINDDQLNFYVRYNFFTLTIDTDDAQKAMYDVEASTSVNRKDDD